MCLAATFGAILGAGGVAYMARQFKNRPKDMKISVYLIHTRMYAQMTVVGRIHSNILIVDRLNYILEREKILNSENSRCAVLWDVEPDVETAPE